MRARRACARAGWSPPLVGDFHVPSRFGKLVFDGKLASAESRARNSGRSGAARRRATASQTTQACAICVRGSEAG